MEVVFLLQDILPFSVVICQKHLKYKTQIPSSSLNFCHPVIYDHLKLNNPIGRDNMGGERKSQPDSFYWLERKIFLPTK